MLTAFKKLSLNSTKFLRSLLLLTFVVGMTFTFNIKPVDAAAPAGTMACTAMSLATTSATGSNNSNTITVTSSATEITAANDFFIRIPSTINARFDTTDTTVGITQSSSGVTSTTVSYPVSDKTVRFDVTTNFASGENVQITGLTILADAVTSATALVWAIDNTTEGSATFSGTSSCTLAVTATSANGSIDLAAGNAIVGGSGTTTLNVTVPVAMASGDTITFTAPARLDLSNLASAVTGTLEASDSITCAAVAQVVTCTTTAATNTGARTIIMTGVTGKHADASASTDITDLAVNDASATPAGADISNDATVALTTTTVGALSSTNVQPASLIQSTSTTNTVSFTTTVPMVNGAKLVIVYPTRFNVSAVNGTTASSLSGLDGTWTASVSSQTVTLTQSGGGATAAGAKSLVLSGIVNPGVTGSGGTYSLTLQIAAGNEIQNDTAVTADTITGGTKETASVLGDVTDVTVTDDEEGGVKITWSEPDDDTTAVQILKGTSPDTEVDGTPLVTISAGHEEYTDEDVEVGQTVFYQLRTTDGISTGDLTEEITFTVGSGATAVSDDTSSDDDSTDDSTDDTSDDSDSSSDDADASSGGGTSVTFTDTLPSWAETAIDTLSASGVIEGNPDGTFGAENNLNRAEAAVMLWRVLMMGDPDGADSMPFTDVALGEWYTDSIWSLKDLSLVSGNPDGTYQPAESINRAEFLQLAMNVYVYMHASTELSDAAITSTYVDLDTSAWYAQVVSNATEWGFVEGSSCDEGTCFNAGSEINRAEAAQILYNMFGEMLADEGESWTVTLDEQDGSGEMGTALITQENGDLVVELTMTGEPEGASQPAHIHSGACGSSGAAVYSLEEIVDGISTTTLDVDWATLVSQEPLYINVHASEEDLDTIVACGNL